MWYRVSFDEEKPAVLKKPFLQTLAVGKICHTLEGKRRIKKEIFKMPYPRASNEC